MNFSAVWGIVVALHPRNAIVDHGQVEFRLGGEIHHDAVDDMQVYITFEVNSTEQPIAFGNEHLALAGFVAGLNGVLDRVGTHVLFVTLPLGLSGAVAADIERPVGERRPLELRHLERGFDRNNCIGWVRGHPRSAMHRQPPLV